MFTIDIDDKYGRLSGTLRSRLYDISKQLPDRKRWKDNILYFEKTRANMAFIMGQLPGAELSLEAQEYWDSLNELSQLEKDALEQKTSNAPAVSHFPFKTKPYEHQIRTFNLAKDRKVFGYFYEMGAGKTKACIDNAAYLYAIGQIDLFVILAPNGVHRQWIKEQLPDHMPDFIEYEAMYYESGMLTTQKGRAEYERVISARDKLRVIAVNIEALSHKSGLEFMQSILPTGRAMLALDESSRIKNHASKRTKNVLSIKNEAEYRRILTGSPVTRGLEDLYCQLAFLDEDILGFTSFYAFRNFFCITQQIPNAPRGAVRITGYQNVEILKKRMEGHTYRVTKEECLDLPEKIFIDTEVDLSEEQLKVYEELKEDFFTALDSGIVTAPLALTRLLRLQQVIAGYLPVEDPVTGEVTLSEIKSPRPQRVVELVQEAQGKTIVWIRFNYDVGRIMEALLKAGIKAVVYTGETSMADRDLAIKRFREDPEYAVFIGNPAAAGIGLNLTAANNVIWYTASFDLEQYLQANDRCHRIGQHYPVTVHHLIAPKTVDRKIYHALKSKKNVADLVLEQQGLRALLEAA